MAPNSFFVEYFFVRCSEVRFISSFPYKYFYVRQKISKIFKGHEKVYRREINNAHRVSYVLSLGNVVIV
jgi:hypothetical protein